jgi:hypothetical protein
MCWRRNAPWLGIQLTAGTDSELDNCVNPPQPTKPRHMTGTLLRSIEYNYLFFCNHKPQYSSFHKLLAYQFAHNESSLGQKIISQLDRIFSLSISVFFLLHRTFTQRSLDWEANSRSPNLNRLQFFSKPQANLHLIVILFRLTGSADHILV